MGRSRRRLERGSDISGFSTTQISVEGAFSGEGSFSVPEILQLPDGRTMELSSDASPLLLRGLIEVDDIRFLRDGNFEVSFRNGDRATLSIEEGRIAFLSGDDDQGLVLAAFARALALRSIQSSDPMGLSMDPATKKAFADLAEVQQELLENPNNPELLSDFAAISEALMRDGLLNNPENIDIPDSPVLPNDLEVNGSSLTRKMSGESEDLSYLSNSARRNQEMADRINDEIESVRSSQGPFAENPMAAFFNADLSQALGDTVDQIGAENISDRVKAAMIVSGQLDPNSPCPVCKGASEDHCPNCLSTGLQPTGKYSHLSAFLDGRNPGQTHGIPITMTSRLGGSLDPTPSQWRALSAMRLDHRGGRRFFILRGPASSGKDTVAREFCAGLLMAKVPVNLGGSSSSGPESAVGTEALQAKQIRKVKTDPETGEPLRVPVFETDDEGALLEKDGKPVPVIDPETGEQKMDFDYKDEAFSVSGANLGEIGRNAHLPVVFVISDPDGHEKEFSRLHDALGSDVANPNGRYVMVDSSSGEVLPLHPSTSFVVTTNEYRTQKNPDGRFKNSTGSRALALEVDAPSEKEEAKRIASMVRKTLSLDTPSDAEHVNVSPELAELDITEEEVQPFVRAQRKLVAAAQMGDSAVQEEVVARTTSYAITAYIANILGVKGGGEFGGTAVNPVDAFVERMTYIIPMNSDSGTKEQREEIIKSLIVDEIGAMENLVGPLSSRLKEIRSGNGDPEKLAREKIAAEKASRNEQQEAEEAAAAKEEV